MSFVLYVNLFYQFWRKNNCFLIIQLDDCQIWDCFSSQIWPTYTSLCNLEEIVLIISSSISQTPVMKKCLIFHVNETSFSSVWGRVLRKGCCLKFVVDTVHFVNFWVLRCLVLKVSAWRGHENGYPESYYIAFLVPKWSSSYRCWIKLNGDGFKGPSWIMLLAF